MCWNNGNGTFDCANEFGGSNSYDVKWGHINNDEYLDLVVANFLGNSNRIFFNNGNRTFQPATEFSWCSGTDTSCSADLGDVDKSDGLDIALGNQKAQDLIYYNEGDGIFSTTDATCYPGATEDLALGDMDNDGWLDLVVVGASQDCVCINDRTGHFPPPSRCFADRYDLGTWRVALGDANGDNFLDIAAAEQGDYPIEVYLNSHNGYFTETLLIGPTWERTWGLAWGDVDNDGKLDLASGNQYQQTVVYFNQPVTTTPGFTLANPIFLGVDSYPTPSVAFGDVDADGDLDLAVGNDRGQNVIYLNTTVVSCAIYLPIIMKDYSQP
jgi:hypothetical protein